MELDTRFWVVVPPLLAHSQPAEPEESAQFILKLPTRTRRCAYENHSDTEKTALLSEMRQFLSASHQILSAALTEDADAV